ncbi:MAG: hypothetical protein JW990_04555 [Thermoleophilia bacterium]|nr:hypothetical protein [Thermoleophilia bacterium]
MADARGSGFLLHHGEKVVVGVLVVACAAYGFWTLQRVEPGDLDMLQKNQRSLEQKLNGLPLTPPDDETDEAKYVVEIGPKSVELVALATDPFQKPKSQTIRHLYQIKPGQNVLLDDHLPILVGKPTKATADRVDGDSRLTLTTDIRPDGRVLVTAAVNDPAVQGMGTVTILDANNNTVSYKIKVTMKIPVAQPPRLLSVQADRRKATIEWVDDTATTAPVAAWVLERRAEDAPFAALTEIPNPAPGAAATRQRYEDTTVAPASRYVYRVLTRYQSGSGTELTKPSNEITAATRSDLSLALTTINQSLVMFEVTKWVQDEQVTHPFNVRPGQVIGHNPNRVFAIGGERVTVDFTTPYVLVDIQPVRVLQRVARKVPRLRPDGTSEMIEIETTWWEGSFQAVVYNTQRKTSEALLLPIKTR